MTTGAIQTVNDTPSATSNRLKSAESRLARAIERMETALENRAADVGEASDLAAQVRKLQAENAELRALVDTTAARLDGAIAKFKTQLAS